jgi:hypothetical protein
MKRTVVASAVFAIALAAPAFAQDKAATEAPKANQPSKKHSHLEERHGVKSSPQPDAKKGPVDKKLHSHPKEKN